MKLEIIEAIHFFYSFHLSWLICFKMPTLILFNRCLATFTSFTAFLFVSGKAEQAVLLLDHLFLGTNAFWMLIRKLLILFAVFKRPYGHYLWQAGSVEFWKLLVLKTSVPPQQSLDCWACFEYGWFSEFHRPGSDPSLSDWSCPKPRSWLSDVRIQACRIQLRIQIFPVISSPEC